MMLMIRSVWLTYSYEYYEHRVDKMESVRIDHDQKFVREKFCDGRKEYLIRENCLFLFCPPYSI